MWREAAAQSRFERGRSLTIVPDCTRIWSSRQVPSRGDVPVAGLMERSLPRRTGMWRVVNVLTSDRCLGRSKSGRVSGLRARFPHALQSTEEEGGTIVVTRLYFLHWRTGGRSDDMRQGHASREAARWPRPELPFGFGNSPPHSTATPQPGEATTRRKPAGSAPASCSAANSARLSATSQWPRVQKSRRKKKSAQFYSGWKERLEAQPHQ